ncbi:MAG: DUF2202 domain-containing protein [Bacteroidota bacterium]
MKKGMIKNWMFIAAILFGLGLSSCDKEVDNVNDVADVTTIKNNNATESDLDGLLYMREEEKLARDVYIYMYNMYQIPVFDNISKSEDFHSNQILGLINYFGLTDPALPGNGTFTNPDLQALYDELIEMGNDSLIAALLVGTTIEEVDIIDLETFIDLTTSDTIKMVYERLKCGSGHHLKAFVAQLAFRGYEFTPQLLTQEQFEEIMTNTGACGECVDPTIYDITEEEEAGLLFMREEEKLAHDVYVYLFDLWNIPVFDFISRSETAHTNRVLALIEYFDLEDPALPNAGEFTNPDLQALYDQLIEQGSESLIAGLTVGATIEEVDIIDLKVRMEVATNNSILTVYTNLMLGSEAHLRAFVAQLAIQGITYVPQFLSQEEFDVIINGG